MDAHRLALSSLVTLIFFLTLLSPSYCGDDEHFVECSCPFECGSIKNISFPFWGDNRPVYCGREGFELECHNSQYFVIKFEALEFRVLTINQSRHIMTIARLDLCDSPCPQKFFNTTSDFTNFDYYASTLHNLTIFYGCPAQLNRSVQNWFRCGLGVGGTNNTAYFVDESISSSNPDEQHEDCNTSIHVPIFQTADLINESVGGVVEGLQKVLNQGFDVDYKYNAMLAVCGECEESGGKCGSNSTQAFLCFCRDHVRRSYCPSNGMQALFSAQYSYSRIKPKHTSCSLLAFPVIVLVL